MSKKHQVEQDKEKSMMAIFVLRENSSLLEQPKEIVVTIDAVKVLTELPSVAAGMAMLLGYCYDLKMKYPQGFRFTFESLQKILMDLDSNKMSQKIRKLNCEVHTAQ